MKFKDKTKLTDGFTLVEIIVVMAIMSIVMMAATSLLIPFKRSSVVQTQLGDVQNNLRLSIDRITKDLRNAGFLIIGNAVSGYNATTLDSSSLVINTRSAVSGHFGSITDVVGDDYTLLHDDQVNFFGAGDSVAIVHPLTGDVRGGDYFEVCATNVPSKKVTIKSVCTGSGTSLTSAQKDAVKSAAGEPNYLLLLAPDPSVLPSPVTQAALNASIIRTITYALEGDALTREVAPALVPGGITKQFLARNITDLRFLVNEDSDGDPFMVTIEIEGETGKAGNDAVGSAKTRRHRSVVSLRNI